MIIIFSLSANLLKPSAFPDNGKGLLFGDGNLYLNNISVERGIIKNPMDVLCTLFPTCAHNPNAERLGVTAMIAVTFPPPLGL
jgi:hypothetical protein